MGCETALGGSMTYRLSFKFRILIGFGLSIAFIIAVLFGVQVRERSKMLHETDDALRLASSIAMKGVFLRLDGQLDKQLNSILYSDELLEFLEDQENESAQLVVSGLFLSLEQAGGVRLSVYDKNFRIILQECSDHLPKRSAILPATVKPVFQQSANDYLSHFYLRGNEGLDESLVLEYCGVMAVADFDDNIVGYVEIAADTDKWVKSISDLTLRAASLSCEDGRFFSNASHPELFENVQKNRKKVPVSDGTALERVGNKYYFSDRIPMLDNQENTLGWLWITRDYTREQMTEHRKKVIVGGTVTLLVLLCFAGVVWQCNSSIIKPIKTLSDVLREESEALENSAAQLSESSFSVSERTTEQAASLEETSASLTEVLDQIRQTSDHTAVVEHHAEESSSNIEIANQAANKLSTAMAEVSQASSETAKVIKEIEEIAFQTNLLALNAAVEAARAGDAGVGFAVVAQEVRNLAGRAQTAVVNSTTLLEGTTDKINAGMHHLKQTNEAFEQTTKGVNEVVEYLKEVAQAAEQEVISVDQISTALHEMEQAVQENAANSEQTSAISQELSSLAARGHANVEKLVLLIMGGNRS